MLKGFWLLGVFSLALFGTVSCDDISAEPKVSPPSVKFSAAGGEATAKVLRMDGGKLRTKWAYKSVGVGNNGFYRKDSTLRIDTLTDGRVKYSSSWYAFYVNMAKNEIYVAVSPNKSRISAVCDSMVMICMARVM